MNLEDQKGGKNRVIITARRTAKWKNRRPSSSAHRALTWRRRTPTAAAERTMSAVSVKTASERLRQRSASSPASSRASGGARVLTRWRGGRRFSLPQGTCIYKEVCGIAQLRRCPCLFTSVGHVASMQHTQSCPTFPRPPSLSDGCSGFSGFQTIRMNHLKQT